MAASAFALDVDHPALAPALAAGLARESLTQTLCFYDEPHRAYHDRRHLREIFDASIALEQRLSPAQTLAVLFHDIAYAPGAKHGSNETVSAHLMRTYAWQVQARVLDDAFAIILDTADHLPRHAGSALVLDFDLMRLAAPPSEFERYSRLVFDEHRRIIPLPDEAAAWRYFERQRAAYFQSLLERRSIFSVLALHQRFEADCRRNLQAALERAPKTED